MSDDVRVDRRARRDPVLLGCLALVLLPFVVGFVRVLFVHWTPVGDWALLELRTRGVGGSHTPLIGPYSRFGWSHPGPALFFVLAIPYRIFGGHANGLLAAVLLVNGASVAGIVLLAWRRGRRPLTIGTAIAIAVLCRALGATFLRDPWNPYVTVLPFALLVFLAWSFMCRDTWMLPIAVVVASFIVQSHVGYAVLVATVLVVAGAWRLAGWWRERREPDIGAHSNHRGRVVALVTVAVAFVAWLPPLIDQMVNPGNMTAIWKFFQKRHSTPTADTAFRLVGRAVSIPASWVTGHETVSTAGLFVPAVAGIFVPVGLLALVVGAAVCIRRRDRDSGALLTLATAILAAGVYSIAHIAGPLAAYLLRWLLVAGMVVWLASAWALWPLVARVRLGPAARRAVAVGCALLLVVPVAFAVRDAARSRAPWYSVGIAEQRLARDTIAHLNTEGHPVLLVSAHEQWWTWGLAARLDDAGVVIAARPRDGLYYGRHRVALRHEARVEIDVVVGPYALTFSRPHGGRLLASYVGRPVPKYRIGPTASYDEIVRLSERSLLSETVAVYEVPLG